MIYFNILEGLGEVHCALSDQNTEESYFLTKHTVEYSPWVVEEEVMKVEVVEGEAVAVVEKCTSSQTSSLVFSSYVIDQVKR